MVVDPGFIGLMVLTLALMWIYGKIRYNEGKALGTTIGMVTGAVQIIFFFKEKKVLDHDVLGNVFRLKDDGLRGELVIDADEFKSKLST